jgi:hypothetical protein
LSVAAIQVGHKYIVSDEVETGRCAVEEELPIFLESVVAAYAEMGSPVREHMGLTLSVAAIISETRYKTVTNAELDLMVISTPQGAEQKHALTDGKQENMHMPLAETTKGTNGMNMDVGGGLPTPCTTMGRVNTHAEMGDESAEVLGCLRKILCELIRKLGVTLEELTLAREI